MSNKNYARRTVVKLYFKGADISKELSKYLLSLSFTDKEEDETDDISLSLDDREGKWIKDWLNTSKAVKTKTETVTTGGGEIKVGAIVKFKGGPVYISSMGAEPTVNRCKHLQMHDSEPQRTPISSYITGRTKGIRLVQCFRCRGRTGNNHNKNDRD